MTGNRIYFLVAATLVMFAVAMILRHWLQMYISGSLRRRFVELRESGRLFVAMAFIVPGFYLLLTAVMLRSSGGSLLIREIRALPMALMFAGMQTMALSRHSVGQEWKCSKCHYDLRGLAEYQPGDSPPHHDAKCPECGEQWGWPGGSIKTMKRWRAGWVALTIILFLPLCAYFASVPIGGLGWWERALLKLVPTPSLVEEVLTSRVFTLHEWAELQTRSTSARDTSKIANALLSRPPGALISPDETAWLTRALSAHAIDPRIVQPRLEGMFIVSAKRGNAAQEVMLTFTPQPTFFAPFAGLDVGVWVASTESGFEQLSAFAVAGYGYSLYSGHEAGPYASSANSNRFRGTATVALMPRGAPRPPGTPPASMMATPTGLYKLDIPLDLPVEPAK
jgi:hypothetical protein